MTYRGKVKGGVVVLEPGLVWTKVPTWLSSRLNPAPRGAWRTGSGL